MKDSCRNISLLLRVRVVERWQRRDLELAQAQASRVTSEEAGFRLRASRSARLRCPVLPVYHFTPMLEITRRTWQKSARSAQRKDRLPPDISQLSVLSVLRNNKSHPRTGTRSARLLLLLGSRPGICLSALAKTCDIWSESGWELLGSLADSSAERSIECTIPRGDARCPAPARLELSKLFKLVFSFRHP